MYMSVILKLKLS